MNKRNSFQKTIDRGSLIFYQMYVVSPISIYIFCIILPATFRIAPAGLCPHCRNLWLFRKIFEEGDWI